MYGTAIHIVSDSSDTIMINLQPLSRLPRMRQGHIRVMVWLTCGMTVSETYRTVHERSERGRIHARTVPVNLP